MKLTLRSLSIVTLGLVSLVVVRPASAGYSTEVVTATFGNPAPLQTYFSVNSSEFAKFNPLLGTLNSVTISVTQSSTVSATVTNNSMITSNGFTVSAFNQITATGLDGKTIAMSTMASNPISNSMISANSMLTNLGTVSGTASGNAVTQTDLSDYIGTGTGVMNVTGITYGTGAITSGNTNTFVSFAGNALVSGTLTVTYNFTPAAVPEPASLVMVAMGLGGVVVAARVRRRSA